MNRSIAPNFHLFRPQMAAVREPIPNPDRGGDGRCPSPMSTVWQGYRKLGAIGRLLPMVVEADLSGGEIARWGE